MYLGGRRSGGQEVYIVVRGRQDVYLEVRRFTWSAEIGPGGQKVDLEDRRCTWGFLVRQDGAS